VNSRRKFKDRFFRLVVSCSAMLGLVIFGVLLARLLIDGGSRLSASFFLSPLSHRPGQSGIFPALVGSFLVVALTLVIAGPIGVATAIYLEEVASPRSRLANLISISVANLAGVPSVIIGLTGLTLFVRGLHLGACLLSGGLTLSLVVLPIVVIVSREALRSIPREYRDAALSLGAGNWQIIGSQLLPIAWPRILTGLLLATSRAFGETAPLVVVGAAYFVTRLPHSVFDAYTVLPLQIFNWSSDPQRSFHQDAAAATLALVSLLFCINLIAHFHRRSSRANH